MARMRAPSIVENAPVRRRMPFWAVPALLLSAYMGSVIADPDPRPEVETAGIAAGSITRALARPFRGESGQKATGTPAQGVASWYGSEFHGLPTASGDPFDMHAMTAAHRTLPLGSHARVTNLENGETVVVQINDRGPHAQRRLIDLSYGAAQELAMVHDGSALVEVVPVAP
jgi:rare lipoprotein A